MKIIEPMVEIITELNGDKILKTLEKCARNCYRSEGNITDDTTSAKKMITKLIELEHTAMLEHYNITVRMDMSVGDYKDLTRHRHASFAIESTRYCSYNKDKFGNEIRVIRPCNIDVDSDIYKKWYETMEYIEKSYMDMSKLGAKPDQLRHILAHSTAASVVMTANIREWRHIFSLRCAKAAHPSVQEIMKMVLIEFHKQIPILFDDLYEKFILEK